MAGDRPRQSAYEIFSIERRSSQFKFRPRWVQGVRAGRQMWILPPMRDFC